ncbi:unnamed protein product [Pylaiella littoralis]
MREKIQNHPSHKRVKLATSDRPHARRASPFFVAAGCTWAPLLVGGGWGPFSLKAGDLRWGSMQAPRRAPVLARVLCLIGRLDLVQTLKRQKRIEHLLHLTLPLKMNWVNITWRQMLGAVERKLSAKCVACGRITYHHVSEMGGPGGWGQWTNSRRQCDGIG